MTKVTGERIEEFCDDHLNTIMVGALVVGYLALIGISVYQNGKVNKRMEDDYTTALMIAVSKNGE